MNLTKLYQLYDRVLEAIAAAMMAIVTLIIVAGFVFRWLGLPLVWYDEVGAISLCWLTYYAGALAALRGAHIGFPGLVNALPANLRVAATFLASAITIFFFGLLAVMGIMVVRILKGDTLVSLPDVSLQITQSVIPITAVLFVIAELIRLPGLLRDARRGPLVDHEIKEALESVGIDPTEDYQKGTHVMSIGLMLIGMFVLVLINVPVAVSLAVVAVAAIWIAQGPNMLPNVALVMFEGATNFPLLAVPLFIFAGGIMNASTISRRLINLATAMLGFIRGGLAMVTVGASMFFAEISGSAVAGVAALGTLLIPAMKARGYSKEFAAAISSSAASLAIIIPPSIPMILYAAMAEELVVKMFVAGFIPGILGGLSLMALCLLLCLEKQFPG